MKIEKIPVGTTLIIETGEYSDYTFHGPFIVVKEISPAEILPLFRAQFKPRFSWKETPGWSDFLGWLAFQLYIIPVPGVLTWHIGCYELALSDIEARE